MSHEHDRRDDGGGSGHAGREQPAPGKRALTDRMRQREPGGGSAGLGHQRAPVSFDQSGEYGEARTTIDHAAPEDPLGFLDDERARHHGKPGKHRKHHRGGAPGDHGQGADGAAAAAPKKLRAEITNLEENNDQDDEGFSRLVVGAGTKHGVTADATFQLLGSGSVPRPGGTMVLKEQRGMASVVSSHLRREQIPPGSKVLVTIPAAKEPELNPDGSIGDDMQGFEA